MDVIAYIRISKKSQGEAGLGLKAQQEYISRASEQNGWSVAATYIDNGVSGGISLEERPQGSLAFKHAKQAGLPLIVAKLDRLSRDVEHIAGLMKRLEFKVCTMPFATPFELHLFAALAEQERAFIRARTREGLAELQRDADKGDADALAKVDRRNSALLKGHKTGLPASLKARKDKADQYARSIEDSILACKARGLNTLQGVADCLNSKGLTTPRGASFTPMTVSRLINKLGVSL